jgi:pimeloyl-ACP methyl ester carboxylesterase
MVTPEQVVGVSVPAASLAPHGSIRPFRIQIPDAQLVDLQERLRRTRWPDAETVDDWSQGVPLWYMQELCRYWSEEYRWRETEQRLNALAQYKVTLDGLDHHFIHARSPHADALPLIMTHGWPGSIVEFEKVIGPLTDPVAHGGAAADAFHVVCPSLPGYGFSERPSATGWGIARIAGAWSTLMARLGYPRYGAQGGDWGSMVTAALGQLDPEHVVGIHLNMPVVGREAMAADDPTEEEKETLASLAEFQKSETGYSTEQATRPQTLGYGLADSPAGQCAWIVEKFRVWADCDGHPENAITRDELLDNVMLYWLPGTGASSARLYWQNYASVDLRTVSVPTGCSIFPKEVIRLSRRWAERRFTDIRYWNELDRGGHFAAFEQPELFVNELRSFFRLVR